MIPKEIINEKWIEVVGEEVFNTLKINDEGWLELNSTKDYHAYNLKYGNFTVLNYDPWKTGEYSHVQDISIRPSSLKGFEKNKGWIKIENEDDLPREDCHCWIIDKKLGLQSGQWKQAPDEVQDKKARAFWIDKATHYQIIIKPELPLH